MKGNIHTDWAISMGIFLLAILTLFIFLKPGIQPIYKENVLLNILEHEFLANTTWSVQQLPLLITTLTDSNNHDPSLHITMQHWIYSTCEITKQSSPGTLSSTCTHDETIIDCTTPDCLKGSVLLTFYPDAETPTDIQEPELDQDLCMNDEGPITDTALCDVQLGSTEEIQGINDAWLQGLKDLQENEGYEQLKENWHYPTEKNFAIYEVNNQGDENLIIGGDPFQQRNIFVRELTYWTLTGNGDRTPITISFRVW